jgi:hypothetical protein
VGLINSMMFITKINYEMVAKLNFIKIIMVIFNSNLFAVNMELLIIAIIKAIFMYRMVAYFNLYTNMA